jgi:hypothetical protein
MNKIIRIDDVTWEAIKATSEVQEWAYGGVGEKRVREYLDESFEHMKTIDDESDIVFVLSENMGGGIPMRVIKPIAHHAYRNNPDQTPSS